MLKILKYFYKHIFHAIFIPIIKPATEATKTSEIVLLSKVLDIIILKTELARFTIINNVNIYRIIH